MVGYHGRRLGGRLRSIQVMCAGVLWAVGTATAVWAQPADLSLYMDFEELQRTRPELWQGDVQHWRVTDRSRYANHWDLPVYGAAGRWCVEGDAVGLVEGVHGKAMEVLGTAEAVIWRDPWTEDSGPQDGISVVLWQKRVGPWVFLAGVYDMLGSRERHTLLGVVPHPTHAVWLKGPRVAGWHLRFDDFQLAIEGGTTEFELAGDEIEEGLWAHHAATYDRMSGESRLYQDGELVEEARSAPTDADVVDGEVGCRFHAESYACSDRLALDDLSIWKRALSADEIRTVMAYGPLALPTAVSAHSKATMTWAQLKTIAADRTSR